MSAVAAGAAAGRRPLDPTLYLVTDTALSAPRAVPDVVRAAAAGGASAVQVRDKRASARDLLALVRAVRDALADHPSVAVLVDDAVDVAVLAGADGVHVGQSDLPAEEVRALLGPQRLVGLSVGSAAEAAAAADLPPGTVDYWGLGPVWATPTKPDAAAPLGLDGLRALVAPARRAGVATVAIGGVDAERAPAVRATGVDGICVVSAVAAAADPRAAAARLLP
ncbi:thiamine phosphate synthase [Quadrisphaera sp. DSM 44207]|uniref:thiamine phosphate synthase n=1 Tax=Quadrisphaera sp. DSM 44207 TaxID=1881057 RepID=UPI0008898941|nr:thiamine phosphate synthase [Quadrisphaera sp. DSM 44207]SDQ36859.1 thiamine-phosphate pyrophosphorylase [Quadrisphaera sp. DSM 44207]